MCEPGYSTQADFVALSNVECVANIQALEILWGFTIPFHLITIFMTVRIGRKVVKKYTLLPTGNQSEESRSASKSKLSKLPSPGGDPLAIVIAVDENGTGRTVSVKRKENKEKVISYYLKFAILTSTALCSIFFLIVAIVKLSDMKVRNFGKDKTVTVLFLLGGTWFYLFIIFALRFLIRMQRKNAIILRANLAYKLALYEKITIPFILLTMVAYAIPVGIMLDYDATTSAMSSVFFSLLAFTSLVLGVVTLLMIHFPLIKVLQSIAHDPVKQFDAKVVSQRQSMEKVLKRAKISACVLASLILIYVPLTIICASFPFMQLRVAYVFPIISIGASLMEDAAVHFQSG